MKAVAHLYEQFQPSHYSLDLTLDRVPRRFRGTVTIQGTSVQVSHVLTLHAAELKVMAATIDEQQAKLTHSGDELRLEVADELAQGEHTLELSFEGRITDSLHGIYPCYFEDNGLKKELLITQFESHYAREVFPCIDEPEAKATFDLRLSHESGLTALSNMPVKDETEKSGATETTFMTTPRMSTYLLAFVVGELQYKETHTKDGVLVRSFATPAQPAETLDFSLEVAKRVIEEFNDYFGVPYPLPKSDHVAVPDFSAGAMENWGLITYREMCLLVDPANTSVATKEYVATVIAHELSHQWFGNLVTMRWWDDLWLNESFATLMEYLVIDRLYPKWNIWMTFATQETLSAQRRDCLPGVQPVRTTVHHPDEISTLFDPSIVYAKGAKLLRMLYFYIGDAAFQSGLRTYFERHAYGNTVGDNLWQTLGEASGKDLDHFMQAWLDQSGYPVVSVEQHGAKLQLSQHRFLTTPAETVDTSVWPIPLALAASNQMLATREASLSLPTADWVKLNKADQSYFLSRYTRSEHRAALRDQVAQKTLDVLDRLQLLNEAMLLARGGEASIVEVFELMTAYQLEASEPIWDIISLIVSDSRTLCDTDDPTLAGLKKFIRGFIDPPYKQLGWQQAADETTEITKLRVTVLGMAVWSEHESALQEALKRFEAFTQPSDVPVELRTIIYAAGSRHQGQAAYDKLMALHDATQSADERNNLCSAMTAATDQTVIGQMLATLTQSDRIRLQDADRWFVYLIRNRYGRQQAWDWLTSHWDWVEANYGGDKSYDTFIRYTASALHGDDWLQRYDAFFGDKRSQPALGRTIAIGHSDIMARTAWVARDLPMLRQYLAATD